MFNGFVMTDESGQVLAKCDSGADLIKSHVKGYTRKDGAFVKEHDRNGQSIYHVKPHSDGESAIVTLKRRDSEDDPDEGLHTGLVFSMHPKKKNMSGGNGVVSGDGAPHGDKESMDSLWSAAKKAAETGKEVVLKRGHPQKAEAESRRGKIYGVDDATTPVEERIDGKPY